MQKNRKKISEFDRRFIIGKSGGRCNKCRQELFVENEFGEKARLGDDAHIVAFSQIGPRGKSQQNYIDRSSSNNLILLCKTCHSEIDQQPQKFSEVLLHQIRNDHYEWVEKSLGTEIILRPRFHYLSYINVPRVDMYAQVNSISLPNFSFANAASFRDLGFNAGRVMYSYCSVLNDEDLYAKEFNENTGIEELQVGSYWFSASANFRSKKIQGQPDLLKAWEKLESIIYRKFKDWKLICLIDPKWITTTTSQVTLSSGSFFSMGLIHINRIEYDRKIALASPLFLGAPDNGNGK